MENLELVDSSSNQSSLLETKITDTNKDTFINKTAISPHRYAGIYDSLLKYAEGIPVVVDYFKRNIPYLEKRSGEVTFSLERSDVEYSFTQIHHLEMKFKDELSTEYNTDNTETTIEGTALLYPGIDPNIGDIFIYELPDNLIGVFIINNVIRLSIHHGSYSEINFHLWNFMDVDIQEKIQSNITEHLYFDKQKYLSNEITLLKDTSYNQLQSLKEYKIKLVKLYISKMYNEENFTLMFSEGERTIYDPLLVEFFNQGVSIKENNKSVNQLAGNVADAKYDHSLWKSISGKNRFLMNDKNNILTKSIFNMWNASITSVVNLSTVLTTNISDINDINQSTVYLYEDSVIEPYVFSEIFYELFDLTDVEINDDEYIENHFGTIDPFELYLVRFLANGTVDIENLIDNFLILYPYTSFSNKDFFYKLPIFLFLINLGIYQIS